MSKRDPRTIRLLLVDDHKVVRVGLQTLLSQTDRIQVIGEAGTMEDAVTEAARLKPDIVLMDVRLPDGSGIEACREIRTARPQTRVLFLTSFADDEAVLATMFAGADGYLLKEIDEERLIRAIETVAGGQSILDPALTQRMLLRMKSLSEPTAASQEELSPQEQKVLALVAEGQTNKEIASSLSLSDKTVRNYLSNVFQKLQVSRRSQAAALYARRTK